MKAGMNKNTHQVCQGTPNSGSVLTGHRRAEEGSHSPTADGQMRTDVPMASCLTKQARSKVSASTGHFSMASLHSPLACPPAETLQSSRAKSNSAFKAEKSRKDPVWYVGTWNVRTLLDNEGPVETARQGREREENEDCRIDLVLRELGRYHIKIAALQETKWFADAEYRVGKSVVLTAGQPTPEAGEHRQRGEGVAIVLTGEAMEAWKAGGEQWKARGSRLITATLKNGGGRHPHNLHVISCYAPTFAASREEKDHFYNDLQQALDEIPSNDMYVMLGDFNARVGSRSEEGDQWVKVRGPHGLAKANRAGTEPLSFLSTNEATVCNTWFQKRDIHKQTWQHPKSKRWHCIDFAIVRQAHRRRCLDASVKRGAECHTDHQLLRIKLRINQQRSHCTLQQQRRQTRRYDVTKQCTNNVTDRKLFQEEVCSRVKEAWKDNGTTTEKWQAIQSALTGAAESILGTEHRRYPDWFVENACELEPLFQHKNHLYSKWLSTGRESDRQCFAKARSEARRAVR